MLSHFKLFILIYPEWYKNLTGEIRDFVFYIFRLFSSPRKQGHLIVTYKMNVV